MSAKVRRICAWSVGIASSLVIISLIITAVLDLQVGDNAASVIAGVAAVVGLAISVITLIRDSGPLAATSARVRSKGRGAIAAGGSIRGNAIGKNAKATGAPNSSIQAASSSSPRTDVSAEGREALSAGGDIADNAIGEGGER